TVRRAVGDDERVGAVFPLQAGIDRRLAGEGGLVGEIQLIQRRGAERGAGRGADTPGRGDLPVQADLVGVGRTVGVVVRIAARQVQRQFVDAGETTDQRDFKLGE